MINMAIVSFSLWAVTKVYSTQRTKSLNDTREGEE